MATFLMLYRSCQEWELRRLLPVQSLSCMLWSWKATDPSGKP